MVSLHRHLQGRIKKNEDTDNNPISLRTSEDKLVNSAMVLLVNEFCLLICIHCVVCQCYNAVRLILKYSLKDSQLYPSSFLNRIVVSIVGLVVYDGLVVDWSEHVEFAPDKNI